MGADCFSCAGRSVAYMQLVDDGLHVLPRCDIGDVQSTSDLAIAQAFAYQLKYVDFTLAEVGHLTGAIAGEDVQD